MKRARILMVVFVAGMIAAMTMGCDEKVSSPSVDSRGMDLLEGDVQVAPVVASPAPVSAPVVEEADEILAVEAEEALPEDADTDGEAGEVELVETEDIMLDSLVLALGVEKRKPVDPGTTFPVEDGQKLYAIMTVKNPTQEESEVSVAWAHEGGGREKGRVTVSVGAQKRWRTWAFTRTVKKAGKWTVIVRDSNDEIIGKAPFEMTI